MTALPEQPNLAEDFPPATKAQWQKLVAATLAKSGVPAEKLAESPESVLASITADGIAIAPLYTRADGRRSLAELGLPGQAPFVRGTSAEGAVVLGWDVRQRHANADVDTTKRAILDDLENGVSSIWLVAGQSGIGAGQLAAALESVLLELAPVVLDAGAETLSFAREFLAIVADRGLDPAIVRASLGADPIGYAARTGTTPQLGVLAELSDLVRDYPQMRVATVDATVYHEAGGNDSDELAIAASVGVAYLRALTAAGQDVDAALAQLEFRYAVTADQFASIAKLRAGRRIWDRIGELSEARSASRGQHQHAVTSASMVTRRDPWVNILRTTIACFAAAVGGAEAITVLPFDAAIGLPDDFSRRIARNTQSVLHDESSLARVIDPGGGSWYLEALTDELAAVAWSKFTALERAGGAVTALAGGAIAELLETSRNRKISRIAHREDPITGVSEFPLLAETPLERPPVPEVVAAGLPQLRYAEPFELLRDRADALAARGRRPAVVLAALGSVSSHTGRVDFARNLFEAGGIAAIVVTGTADELAEALTNSGASVACLCASDSVYADEAAAAAGALKAAGAQQVWIAGKPALVQGDIDAALYAGCDAVAVLTDVLDHLEVHR